MEGQNAPKLRFPEFTGPWERRKLGDIAAGFDYGLNVAATDYDGKNKYVRITDIDDDTHLFKTDDLTSPDTDLANAGNYKLSENDILFARTGASVGKAYKYMNSDGDVYFAGFLIRAKVKPEYDAEFIFQNTLTDNYDKFIRITSQRSGQPGVNAQEYQSFEIMAPKLDEQRRIGAFLQNLDHLITLHQRKCDEFKTFKKAMLQKMFPKEGEKVPEIRFSGFTDPWEQRKVSELCSISTGKSNTQDKVEDGEYPFYVRSPIIERSTKYLYDEEAVLTVGDGVGTGKVFHYVNGKYDLHQRCYRMYGFTDELNAHYFYHTFSKLFYKRVMAMTAKTSVDSVRLEMIADMEIPCPNIKEQEKIGVYFDNLDNLITLHQRKRDELKELKKGLLQQMFV